MGFLRFMLFGVFLVTLLVKMSLSLDKIPNINRDNMNPDNYVDFDVPVSDSEKAGNTLSPMTTGASVHADNLDNGQDLLPLPNLDELFLEESDEKSVPETSDSVSETSSQKLNDFGKSEFQLSNHDDVNHTLINSDDHQNPAKTLPDIDDLFNDDATDLKVESQQHEFKKVSNVNDNLDSKNDSVEDKLPEVNKNGFSDIDFKDDNENQENKEKQNFKGYVKSDLEHEDTDEKTDMKNGDPKERNNATILNNSINQQVRTDDKSDVKLFSPDAGKKVNVNSQEHDGEVPTPDYVDKNDSEEEVESDIQNVDSDKMEMKNDDAINTKSSSLDIAENKDGETGAHELSPNLKDMTDVELPSLDDFDELKSEDTEKIENDSLENEEITVFNNEQTDTDLPSLDTVDDLKSEDTENAKNDFLDNDDEIVFDSNKHQYGKNYVKVSDKSNKKIPLTEKESKHMDKSKGKMMPSQFGDSADISIKNPTSGDNIENYGGQQSVKGADKANKVTHYDTEKEQEIVNAESPSSTEFAEESKDEENVYIPKTTENDSQEKNKYKDLPEESDEEESKNVPKKIENDKDKENFTYQLKGTQPEITRIKSGNSELVSETDKSNEEDEDDEAYTDINDVEGDDDKKTDYINREGEKVNEDDERPEEVEQESHDTDENYDTEKWSKSEDNKKGDDKADIVVDDFEEDEIMKNSQHADISRHPPAPSSMVLLYTWMIVAVLIVVVGISTYQSRCKGLKIPFFSKKNCHGEDKKRLLDHEFV